MLDPRPEHFSCLEPMLLIPFCRHVGKAEDGPPMPKLSEELNDALGLYMLLFVFAINQMDCIDVIASCMIFREPMSFLKPFYRDCVSMASYVHNGTDSSSVHGI